ncbi:serine/threonine-protein kinase [Streptomyces sp. NPDC006197]|uniref:serine/threonine-protein kinase n=1 Tax=Streptomyces sp. NPDC006197 TaxID=3156685 RepID=UPI0033AAE6F5
MEQLIAEDPAHIGPYRLIARLGAGGMGLVYLGRSEDGRTVAVKVVQAEYAAQPDFRRRFALEVDAAQRVGGAWTAAVLDSDTEARVPWVATRYVPGPSLHDVVARDFGPLPEASVRFLAEGLAHALIDIHAAGLIHRDLKPSNVLVTVDGPRVIDFGIARALETLAEGPLTRTGAVIGSPGFMSPEQVRGQRLTPASDVFCLGSVLAFAATGRSPFGTVDSGLHSLMFRVAEEEPDLVGVPEALLPLVRECLRKDPSARPTPQDLAARTAIGSSTTWLPGEVLAQLGRSSAQLLDFAPARPQPLPAAPAQAPAHAQAATPTPTATPTATPTSLNPHPALQALPPPSPGGFPYDAPTQGVDGAGRPPTPRRRPAAVVAAAAAAVVLIGGGLVALNLWRGANSGDDGGGGSTSKALPDGFAGAWVGVQETDVEDTATGTRASLLTRLTFDKGARVDQKAEYAVLGLGRLCVYSPTVTSATDGKEQGATASEVSVSASTLKRAEPMSESGKCEQQQPAMTLKNPADGKVAVTSGNTKSTFLKDGVEDPKVKSLDTFNGQWYYDPPDATDYELVAVVVGHGPGPRGVQISIQPGGTPVRMCVYLAQAFTVLEAQGSEEPKNLSTTPGQLQADLSGKGCAQDGPLFDINRTKSSRDLSFSLRSPGKNELLETGKLRSNG